MDLPPVRLPPAPAGAEALPNEATEMKRLRALVADGMRALAGCLEQHFGPALENARRAWERADDIVIVDRSVAFMLTDTRRHLYRATTAPSPALRAVALECLLAFDAACGMTGLAERRLSALIRLRTTAGGDLLPGGRPFLDLGRALGEAARAFQPGGAA